MRLAWIVSLGALLVTLVLGVYATDFAVYLGNDPAACNNCHVMDAAFEGWYHSGHRQWASCNECHTPHAFIPKYFVKARSGYRHVSAFLLGHIPDAIRAIDSSQEVIQDNCIRCHTETIANVAEGQMDPGRYCFECHRSVAHGSRGASVMPYQNLYPSQEK